jgi:shikimate kinase
MNAAAGAQRGGTMDQRNIVLIGMPGAGKSTVGVLLAKALGLSFTDTDLLIQEREGRLLQEIIDRDGVREFLRKEEAVIFSLGARGAVIATGGSAVYSDAAIARLKEYGRVVWLKATFAEIERRVKNMRTRGIAVEPGRDLRALFDERNPLYQAAADLVVECTDCGVEETVSVIAEALGRDTEPLSG